MRFALGLLVAAVAAAVAMVAVASAGPGKGIRALPPGAVKVGEDAYYVGKRTVDGVVLEGYAFVHRRGEARPDKKPGGGGGTTCYSLLASGAKWKNAESFLVDESSAPISGMTSRLNGAVSTWEAVNAANADIFGGGTRNDSYSANLSAVDGVNGAEFGPIADPGVIAVTYTWGRFGGPPQARELVEWDMVFDTDSFSWSTSGERSAMDFLSIATHELGHAMGLGHPASTCTLETMYAYASDGETIKRDLNAGDIAGINVMY